MLEPSYLLTGACRFQWQSPLVLWLCQRRSEASVATWGRCDTPWWPLWTWECCWAFLLPAQCPDVSWSPLPLSLGQESLNQEWLKRGNTKGKSSRYSFNLNYIVWDTYLRITFALPVFVAGEKKLKTGEKMVPSRVVRVGLLAGSTGASSLPFGLMGLLLHVIVSKKIKK